MPPSENASQALPTRLSRRDGLWALAYLPLSVAFTWPLVARLGSALAGNAGDNWQSLWGFVHVARSLARLENPFFTHDLWHPDGATLVFQTFDLPDAILASLLMPLVGPWRAFNLVYLWIFAACAASMFLLARDRGASRPAAFLSGAAYSFTVFHFGHAVGHLHIVAMQWVPVYVLALGRVLGGEGWRWALGGAVALALASLSSWYHLVGSFVVTVPLVAAWALRDRCTGWRHVVPQALGLCAAYLGLVGPLGMAMLRARAADPVAGSHPARVFSADLEAFVFPNAGQALHAFSDRWLHWTGNGAENASYLGFVLVAICLAGLAMRVQGVGTWLAVALLGAVLSLGPALHVGGRIVTGDVLPYAWLERAVPLMSFMGVPVRFGFAATFALAAALAPSLDALAARWGWRLVLPLGLLVFPEHLPNALPMSSFSTPPIMRKWSESREDFAVLDASRDSSHLWHQVVHGKPVFGGYLTRTPERLERRLAADPVAGPLVAWEAQPFTDTLVVSRVDWQAFDPPILPGAEPTHFSFELRGQLVVTTPGRWVFRVESDDSGELFVDGRRVVDVRGSHAPLTKTGEVELSPGDHAVEIRYRQDEGGARLVAAVQAPGSVWRVLGPEDVPGGFAGPARARRRATALSRDAALEHLRSLRVKWIVQPADDSAYLPESQLGLAPAFTDGALRIYEVP